MTVANAGGPVQAAVTTLLDAVLEAVERRGMTHAEIALRVGCHPRSISRLLTGRTCSPVLLDRVARVLRVGGKKMEENGRSLSPGDPVVGWAAASHMLGMTYKALWLRRRRARDRHGAWWASAEECRAWARALVEGG